jgi:transposase
MARPRAKLDVPGQAELVEERLKKEPSGIMRERLLAVKLGFDHEVTLDEIAERMGRSRATIQSWLDSYRAGGVEGLEPADRSAAGRKPALDERAEREFRKKLAKGSFRTAAQARDWVESRFRVKRSAESVRRWMGKLGARLKVVRPRHPGSDQMAGRSFRQRFARLVFEELKASGVAFRGRPLRLWVADEGRFGLKPCHRRAWVSRGVRAHKDSSRRFEWSYVWAALQIGGGGSEFFYSNVADIDMSRLFLRQISARDPQAVHVVIWDGAGFHPRSGQAGVPDNVVLVRQPPYSPELNPVEKLWDMLRDALCNRSWQNLEDLMSAVSRWLKEFWGDVRRIFSLIGHGWMLAQANA